jgi:hypothetical protein
VTDDAGGDDLAIGQRPAQALATGAANVIALVYGNNGRSAQVTYGGGAG